MTVYIASTETTLFHFPNRADTVLSDDLVIVSCHVLNN